MKRKALLMLGLVAALGATNVAGAFAAEGEGATSGATVGFDNENGEGPEDGNGTTPPTDPEYPGEEIDPDDADDEEGGITNNTGKLRIDYVSNFKFGTYKIVSGTQTLYADVVDAMDSEGNEFEVPNYVQLSDLRGTGEGWNLTVSQNGQFETEDGAALNGAQLTIANIQTSTDNENGAVSVPDDYAVTLNPEGEENVIMRAEKGEGYGTHIAHFGTTRTGDMESGAKSVSLEIPGSATILEADYATTLTWTLSDTPGAEYK